MNYGVDTTKPVQLYPNEPGKRTPGRPGYVYRFAFFGHPGLTVSADPWNVRKITREDVDADHTAALEIVAMVDAQLAEANHPAEAVTLVTGQLADGDAEYIGHKPHPRHITPGTMGRQMIAWSARVREVATERGMTRQEVLAALPARLFAR